MIITKEVKFRGKMIPVSKLTKSSTKKVKVQCPICNEVREVMYKSIIQAGHHICLPCIRLINQGKRLNTGDVYGRLTVIDNTPSESLVRCECGNIKYVNNFNLTSGKTKSCSCLRVDNMNNIRVENYGEDHGMWKGGTSTQRERFMQTKEYKNWRSEVFKRDNYTCHLCNTRGYKLVAHHIKNYSEYLELRVDINNGIKLCEKCHTEFHNKYGYTNNKLSQIKEVKK